MQLFFLFLIVQHLQSLIQERTKFYVLPISFICMKISIFLYFWMMTVKMVVVKPKFPHALFCRLYKLLHLSKELSACRTVLITQSLIVEFKCNNSMFNLPSQQTNSPEKRRQQIIIKCTQGRTHNRIVIYVTLHPLLSVEE